MAINLQTIETLPLVEEVNENTSLVGWDGEKTVRVAGEAIGGAEKPKYIAVYKPRYGESGEPRLNAEESVLPSFSVLMEYFNNRQIPQITIYEDG